MKKYNQKGVCPITFGRYCIYIYNKTVREIPSSYNMSVYHVISVSCHYTMLLHYTD